ncbi:MAG: hypothetical protein RCG15_01945 [Candidatus Rickettsia vulgarisii]
MTDNKTNIFFGDKKDFKENYLRTCAFDNKRENFGKNFITLIKDIKAITKTKKVVN